MVNVVMKKTKTKIRKKSICQCPSCSHNVFVGLHPKIGDLVVCNQCYLDMEIVNLNPIILDWAVFETGFYYEEDGIKIR